jgi:hypothetical protein
MSEKPYISQPSGIQSSAPHYRMTAESLKQDYDRGLITTAGYIHYYIKAKRKDGWKLRIKSVSQFCKELGITRPAFYRAKAHLISNNLLAEEILGGLDLWVPIVQAIDPDENVTGIVTDVTLTGQSVTQPDTLDRERYTVSHERYTDPPETQAEQASCKPSDLLQISHRSFSLSPEERELIDFVQRKLRNTEGIRDLRAYAIAILEKDRDHWQNEFEREQQKADLPPPPPRPVEKISAEPEETPAMKLERYKVQWTIPACRPGIRKAIAAHPEWNITLDQIQGHLPEAAHEHQHDDRDPRRALPNGSPPGRAVPPSRSRPTRDSRPDALHQSAPAIGGEAQWLT